MEDGRKFGGKGKEWVTVGKVDETAIHVALCCIVFYGRKAISRCRCKASAWILRPKMMYDPLTPPSGVLCHPSTVHTVHGEEVGPKQLSIPLWRQSKIWDITHSRAGERKERGDFRPPTGHKPSNLCWTNPICARGGWPFVGTQSYSKSRFFYLVCVPTPRFCLLIFLVCLSKPQSIHPRPPHQHTPWASTFKQQSNKTEEHTLDLCFLPVENVRVARPACF